MKSNNSPEKTISLEKREDDFQPSRRKFLGYAGATGLIAVGLASCSKILEQFPESGNGKGNAQPVNLGSGDTGILNYAYALEQLEAAFYTIVIGSPYFGINALEFSRLKDIRDHEISHREFFKDALGTSAIPQLVLDFSTVNFTSRTSVLATAKAFEDLGVSAYNGAGSLIVSADYLTLAGKIVSVEARHAAFIRDLISYGSFADSTVLDSNGLDTSRTPAQVLPLAGAFIKNTINASGLPTS
jgi:hypothetical protein